MPATITIAHLTDVHLGPIAGFTPRYWNLKRLLGYVNWLRNRRDAYRMDVLDRIVADLEAQAPDHIAVTGDLVNIGLPQEHINALAWIESLGSPGGRDRHPRQPRHLFAPAQRPGDGALVRLHGVLRARGRACRRRLSVSLRAHAGGGGIIGVNSAVPTPPLVASGRLGEEQLARLGAALERLGQADVFRLVLIHHPPLPGQAKRFRGLEDAAGLEAVLSRHGAELVLHGHNHRNMLAWVPTGARAVPVVGAPSAALGRHHKGEPLARYNLYRIAGPPWEIELVGRGLKEAGGAIVELERRMLSPAGLA